MLFVLCVAVVGCLCCLCRVMCRGRSVGRWAGCAYVSGWVLLGLAVIVRCAYSGAVVDGLGWAGWSWSLTVVVAGCACLPAYVACVPVCLCLPILDV